MGLAGGFALVGGALVPRVDRVKIGALGFVSGLGTGTGAPRDELRFVAVFESWSGLLGLTAPNAGSFLG